MKKVTLIAALAAVSLAANAQYVAETPYLEPIATDPQNEYFDVIYLDAATMEKLQAQPGKKVQDIGPNEETRFLYVWEQTVQFNEASATIPGVGWSETEANWEGGMNCVVGSVGWSGLGYCLLPTDTSDFTHLGEDTHFHIAFKTIAIAPPSIGLILFGGPGINGQETGAKIAVGDPYNDNGVIYPAVGPKLTDEWYAVDIKFSDIKKIWTGFDYTNYKKVGFDGNILSMLLGGVTGQNACWDAVYFYTPGQNGIGELNADNTTIIYTGRTINASGANGITLYDLTGKAVKSTRSTVMGVEDLAAGVYVVKAGNQTQKIVVR